MENNNTGVAIKSKAFLPRTLIAIGIVAIIAIAAVAVFSSRAKNNESTINVVSIPTLQKIVNVNELSTFTSIYNGVAKIMNKDDPNENDYYVSYNAKVDAGIDVEKIEISVDEDKKIITITLPEIYITNVTVDSTSLDFIFLNDDANTNTAAAQAYKICEADARDESNQQAAIKELAKQNAVNIFTALTRPFIEQLDDEYALVIQ